jgi:hypothetical protein
MIWLALIALSMSAESRVYAMQISIAAQVKNPNPMSREGWKTARTTSWSLVRWTQDGERVVTDERLCGLYAAPVLGATTTFPSGFVRGFPTQRRTGRLSAGQWTSDPLVQVIGARVADASTPLPSTAEAAEVVDMDKDGKPGVTVNIAHSVMGGGDVYVTQRSVATLSGTVGVDGRIVGVVRHQVEQRVLGATTWWLKLSTGTRPHPDASQSTFVLAPVDATATCATVLSARGTLFP